MCYSEQAIAFYRWKEVNPLPASAIALWHELAAVCDKAGCPEEFTIQNAVLQASAGLSRKEFERARQILSDLGLLRYKKSQRVNTAGKYSVVDFPIVQKGQQEGQREGQQKEHRRGNERDTLYKDLKDFKSSISLSGNQSSTPDPVYESFYSAHERVWGFALNPMQSEKLGSYLDDGIEEPVIIRAIERAAQKGTGYSIGLITKILEDYFRSGARTLMAAEALDTAHETRREEQNRRREEGQHAKYGRRSENTQHGSNQAESEFAFLDRPN